MTYQNKIPRTLTRQI
ncbi:hypothetical protein D041_3853A, partial [Vibrio parahaemolyticus EKP-008]